MGERPEISRMIEEEASKLAPEERHHEASSDIGKMIDETLAEGNPPAEKADQPVDDAIKPLTIAEYRSTQPRHVVEAAEREKEQEARLELDRATKASAGVDAAPHVLSPSGLELDDRRPSTKTPTNERRQRLPDESMEDVLSMKKADARPPMAAKKKRGLLGWLRGE